MDDTSRLAAIALAGAAAGAVNALAGGGTLITFPVLTMTGLPAVTANVTSTVALAPGYLGGVLGQKSDLAGQGRRLTLLLPAAVIGGLTGGLLLLGTGERLFRELVPWLILLASVLLALQEPVRKWLTARLAGNSPAGTHSSPAWAVVPIGLAALYGGYFGAGLSVIILAVLGLVLEDTLTRLNALKQAIAFGANMGAAILFLFSGRVDWPSAGVMAVAALVGGAAGGRLAGRVKPAVLRWIVVLVGVGVAIVYFLRG